MPDRTSNPRVLEHTASQSLQAMQRSSPEGYRRRACSPRNRGEMGPYGGLVVAIPLIGISRSFPAYLFERVVDCVTAPPLVHGLSQDVQNNDFTYGGRKYCSSSTYIPLAISVNKKNFPMRSSVESFSHTNSLRLLRRKFLGSATRGVA